ncbi:hypothetical protein BGZ57DRAFT_860197 [Hyaloscypha finlandica]|nr:hypothetical protein BGZ57DRAFT_860197 [Hyaloscypha finlandica]
MVLESFSPQEFDSLQGGNCALFYAGIGDLLHHNNLSELFSSGGLTLSDTHLPLESFRAAFEAHLKTSKEPIQPRYMDAKVRAAFFLEELGIVSPDLKGNFHASKALPSCPFLESTEEKRVSREVEWSVSILDVTSQSPDQLSHAIRASVISSQLHPNPQTNVPNSDSDSLLVRSPKSIIGLLDLETGSFRRSSIILMVRLHKMLKTHASFECCGQIRFPRVMLSRVSIFTLVLFLNGGS